MKPLASTCLPPAFVTGPPPLSPVTPPRVNPERADVSRILDLLVGTSRCIEEAARGPSMGGSPADNCKSAAWRLADAGVLLRAMLEDLGVTTGSGVSDPTGRGAMLPLKGPAWSITTATVTGGGLQVQERHAFSQDDILALYNEAGRDPKVIAATVEAPDGEVLKDYSMSAADILRITKSI